MSTVFESISDGFYTAFFEPDQDKRKDKIEAWIKESSPVIQSAVENELRIYLEKLLKDSWTEKGWESRAKSFFSPYQALIRKKDTPLSSFIDEYKLTLDVTLRKQSPSKDVIVNPLTHEVREKTNKAIDVAKIAIAKLEPPSTISLREIDLHNDYKVEVAIPMLEKFLEESYRDNVRRVRIIHGKGIFVLQKAVREYLEKHRLVLPKSISSADKDHGGEGATEANLIDFDSNLL
ncbi:Smr/MutS family protein [Chloroflexota bacterium]